MVRFVLVFGLFFCLLVGLVSAVDVTVSRFVIPGEVLAGSGGGLFPVVDVVDWVVVDDLVFDTVYLSLDPVKSVSLSYFVDSVPFDASVVSAFLFVDGVRVPVFLFHDGVGRYFFDYDFSSFPDGLTSLVVFFDGRPFVLSFVVDSSPPLFALFFFCGDWFSALFDGRLVVSLLVYVIVGLSLLSVGLFCFVFFKRRSSKRGVSSA